MIPQTTTPLTKLIRTTEGILVVVANGALILVPIITSSVPPSLALKLGVILNGATLVARSVLKAVASLQTHDSTPSVLLAGNAADPSYAEAFPEALGASDRSSSFGDERGARGKDVGR